MTDRQLADARLGFERLLRSKGFPRQFVDKHSEDLLARANFELARKIEGGEKIENPPGLLITIAYRRTQNLLESKERAPDFVGLESVAEVADEDELTPEATTLDRDRVAKLHAAVERLTLEERKIVALEFFQKMNLSEAARELGWAESKARRRRDAAMEHLKDFLGVDCSDDVLIDAGFLCWIGFAFGQRVGFNLAREAEAVWHRVEDLKVSLLDKIEPAAHKANARLNSDPATATAAGGVARTAKVCVGTALCALTAGAGVAVVGNDGGSHRQGSRAATPRAATPALAPARLSAPRTAPVQAVTAPAQAPAPKAQGAVPKAKANHASTEPGGATEPAPSVEAAQEPHPSQPPPEEVIEGIEETNRPHHGPAESHPSSGPEGSAVGPGTKSSGETPAEEALTKSRP